MCVQTITTDQDCLYLNFLNNCNPDRAYPPLRMYRTNDFLIIDADDNNQISIALVGFEVDINGETYTDVLEAERQLALEIQCVNNSRTSDSVTSLKQIVQQLEKRETLTFFNLNDSPNSGGTPFGGFPFDVAQFQLGYDLDPVDIQNVAPAVTVNNTEELADLFNQYYTKIQLSSRDADTLYINAGTDPVPTNAGSSIAIVTQNPAGVLIYGKGTAPWSTELDAEMSSVNCIEEKVTQFIDGKALVKEEVAFQTYAPAIANQAVAIVSNDITRELLIVQVLDFDAFVRFDEDTVAPGTRRGLFVKAGGTAIIGPLENGKKYQGPVSIINANNGEAPRYNQIQFRDVN